MRNRKFRHIYTLFILVVAFTAASCENVGKSKYSIFTSPSHVYSSSQQTVTIEYVVGTTASEPQPIRVSATPDCDWITNINNQKLGELRIDIAENSGEQRTATIEIACKDVKKPVYVEITQLASSNVDSYKHALIFYFFGTSLDRYFGYNIEDASTAISQDILKQNRVLYVRQLSSSKAKICELSYNPIDNSTIDTKIKTIDIDSKKITSQDICNTLNLIDRYVSADRYGIVLAGHGRGWVPIESEDDDVTSFSLGGNMWTPAIGAETTRHFGENNTLVEISELAAGIESSNLNVDYLLFDACFMSNIETLYELRNTANYIIASPCEIMGRGFPYHRVLPHLFANNGKSSDIMGAAESYYLYYRDEYTGAARCGSVAVIDCREIDALAEATSSVIATAISEYDTSTLQTYEGQSNHIFYDFGEWCSTVATDQNALDVFNKQYNRTVIAKYTLPTFYSAFGSYGTYPINEEVYSGVTTSAPSSVYPNDWINTEWYKRVWK